MITDSGHVAEILETLEDALTEFRETTVDRHLQAG